MSVRKSAAQNDERSLPMGDGPIIPGDERMQPPPELRPAEAKIWLAITGRLPADWFTSDNAPLLKEMCRHIAVADELAADEEALRAQIVAIKASSETESAKIALVGTLTKSLHSTLKLHMLETNVIGNLATKLRLTNQSRWQPLKAENQRERAAEGPKPWENWMN